MAIVNAQVCLSICGSALGIAFSAPNHGHMAQAGCGRRAQPQGLPEAARGPVALPSLKSSQDPAFPALVGCKNGRSAVRSRLSGGGYFLGNVPKKIAS